ncbi:ribonuclease E/G [Clostridium oceanicum]|uniref:Ribonuclease E/G n=1 Tax=Clostridium oceanicum TaxID=1543 RepID=A0ABP3V6A6_9CLOT
MKQIFIERQRDLLRIAVRHDKDMKELYIEENDITPSVGEIYIGKVKNIVPGIKSAFIDIGTDKNAYLYMDKKFNNLSIKKGEYILVQILKEGINKKGPKVTNAISIPGKYTVIETLNKNIKFSKKIKDDKFKAIIEEKIKKPKDVGLMIRTNSTETKLEDINLEIDNLYNIYNDICKKGNCKLNPGMVFDNGGTVGKLLRDKLFNKEYKIYVDNKKDYEFIKGFSKDYFLTNSLTYYKEKRNLFDYYGIENEILSLTKYKVFLKCGGYITIDRTEAMYVIDVNTGKNTKFKSMKKTVFTTNMEASEEITKQILLRNLSGIILIDFIDMEDEDEKIKILDKLNEGLKRDKSKTVIYPFTELNLLQIARRRQGKSIYEHIEEPCICCNGNAYMLKFSYVKLLIRNLIMKIEDKRNTDKLYIEIDSRYKKHIENEKKKFIEDINAYDKKVYLKFVEKKNFYDVQSIIFEDDSKSVEKFKFYG